MSKGIIMKCENCGARIMTRESYHYTPETFKKTFKVGDVVSNTGWGKTVVITGIGRYRFFSIDSDKINEDLGSQNVKAVEKPNTMFGNWRKYNATITEY